MNATLVTGADGYLGQRVAKRLVARGEQPWLWVRAATATDAAHKRAMLDPELRQLPFSFGELRCPQPFVGIDRGRITRIIHSAAVTRFNVDDATASAVNRDGTAKLVRFAAECPALERFSLVSTLYASGLTPGSLTERPLEVRPAFANAYERSKWEAERVLVESDLPWQVLRVATVLADDASGRCGQATAVHNTLRLLKHGLLPVMPGDAVTPLYFVTGDYAADAIAGLALAGREREVYHLSHDAARALRLGALLELAREGYGDDPQFRRRRLLSPPLCALAEFEVLSSGVAGLPRGVLQDTLTSLAPFAAQLYVHKQVEVTHAQRDAGAFEADLGQLVLDSCRALARTGS